MRKSVNNYRDGGCPARDPGTVVVFDVKGGGVGRGATIKRVIWDSNLKGYIGYTGGVYTVQAKCLARYNDHRTGCQCAGAQNTV